jgi:RNA polymerase sigma-70 factor (ECF subfamily)
MLAHAQTASFPASRSRVRASGAVLQLFRARAMNRPAEVAEMDALLLRVAAERDRSAFAALFTHFAPRVKAYLIRLGASSGVAEELAQEALLSVWRKAHLFDPAKASAATWLFTIARNLRIDAIRREKRPELDPEDFMPEPGADADAGLMLAENEGRLRLALRELPVDQIQVVELSFFADKPHSQIAEELGIPRGTVKSRLRLAMGRLKRAMGGDA